MTRAARDFESRFPGLTRHFAAGDSEVLLEALVPSRLDAGETLIVRGSRQDELYLVEHGHLSVDLEQGREHVSLGRVGPGSFVGELGLIEPGPASATVRAMEDVALLELSHEAFMTLTTDAPATAAAVLQALSVDLARRLRESGVELLTRVGEHEWSQVAESAGDGGWLRRLARLLLPTDACP